MCVHLPSCIYVDVLYRCVCVWVCVCVFLKTVVDEWNGLGDQIVSAEPIGSLERFDKIMKMIDGNR